jgi:hypothetical protein
MNSDFHSVPDQDPAFYSYADPNPASKNNAILADPDQIDPTFTAEKCRCLSEQ